MTDGLENPRRADMFLSLIGLTSCAGTAAYVIIQKLAPVYLLPLAVASAALVGWMRLRQLSRLAMDVERSSMRLFLLAATIFFALVSTSLLLFVTRDSPYERPTGFFVIVAIMAGLLGVEAISVPQDSRLFGLILAQTGLLGIELMWTQSLMFPEVLGVDSAWHQAFTELTLKAGRLPDGYSYSNLPLMHLQIGSFQLITGWSYKWSSLFAVGSTQVLLSLLFVFLIAKALFSFRVGLLSAVLLVVSGSFVQFSWWVTPFAFAVVYCLAALYLQIVMRRRNPIASLVLALFFMFCIILTHPITSTWMAVLLFV